MRFAPQAKCGNVHQAHAAPLAGQRQRGGRHVVDAIVGCGAALAQDADRVDDHMDVADQGLPDVARGERFEVGFAQFAVAQAGGELGGREARVARADDHGMPAAAQRGDGMAADEPGAAQDHYLHFCSFR